MNLLPGHVVTWNQSAESLATFLRYQVYRRRKTTDTAWTKLVRITDRGVTSYEDYTVWSGTVYEYAVTQVATVGGEDLESDFPAAVEAEVVIESAFVHAVRTPATYAEVFADAQEVSPGQSMEFLQVWNRQAPTAHIGNDEAHVVTLSGSNFHWEDESDVWRAIRALQTLQRTAGAVLMVRQGRDVRFFCQLVSAGRGDRAVAYGLQLTLREVHFKEEVD